jgi:ribonuclease Z
MANGSLYCFGVGDGFPTADRGHSAFLYQLPEANLLIDCGDGLTARYTAAKLSYDLFDAAFVSHLHADHVGGLAMFLQSLWLRKRKKPLPIYTTADGLEPIRQFLRAGYLFDELFPFPLTFTALQAAQAVTVSGATVTPFRTTHLDGFAKHFAEKYRQNFDAFSFLIETPTQRIAHSADLGAPEDLAPLVAKDLDLLVCEVAHFRSEALFRFLAGRTIRKLVLIHLPEALWKQPEALLAEARQALPHTAVSIAQPGEVISL